MLSFWVFLGAVAGTIALQAPLSDTTTFPNGIFSAHFDRFIDSIMSEWAVQGLSVAIVSKDSKGEWRHQAKGWGVADRHGNPVSKDTLFNIASNTKLFTALSLGLLVENDTFSNGWNTKVYELIPDQWDPQDPFLKSYGDLVDIFSHRTGLPRHDLSYRVGEDLESVVRSVQHLKPSAELRQTVQYNNIMYITGAFIVQQYSGIQFPDFVEDRIFTPLGLRSSTFDPVVAFESGQLAEGFMVYQKNASEGEGWAKNKYRPIPYWCDTQDARVNAGAGGIISSAEDMATWIHTLLLNGRSPKSNESVIPASAIRHVMSGSMIWTPRPEFPELSAAMYGHGQRMSYYQGHQLIEHGGSTPGFRTQIARFPDDDLGIVILSNSDTSSLAIDIIKFHIAELYIGLKHVDWNARYLDRARRAKEVDKQVLIPRKDDAPLPRLPVRDLATDYAHSAYGHMSLCALPSGDAEGPTAEASVACQKVISSVGVLLDDVLPPSKAPRLVSHSPRLWGTHFVFTHFSNNTFNVTFWTLVQPADAPTAHDKSEQPFILPTELDASTEPPTLTFDINDEGKVAGFGLRGVWGAGAGVPALSGDSVKERSEVWFQTFRK